MKRILLIASLSTAVVGLGSRAAHAQAPAVGSPDAPDQTLVEGAGVRVGEGTVLHPSVGAETGYVSNVFYTDTNADGAGLLRVLAELNFASLSQQRLVGSTGEGGGEGDSGRDVGDLQWHAGLRLVGQEYLSGNDAVGAQHNVAGGANIHGIVFPEQTWRFAFDEDYIRDTRPTNYESYGNLDRDINALRLSLLYAPLGRALSGAVRYENRIDIFEASSHSFANRIQHTLGFRVNWQWLPITKVYLDVSAGLFSGLGNSSVKVSSSPIRAMLGIQTALSVDTSINARLGYGDALYASGPSFSNVIAGLAFAWRYSPVGQMVVGYSYDFSDSVQANYFRDHTFQVGVQQQHDRLMATASADVRLRDYEGILPNIRGPAQRSDLVFGMTIGGRWYFRDTAAVTADYELLDDSTSYTYMASMGGPPINPSYVRHQIMAGVRATW